MSTKPNPAVGTQSSILL